MLSAYAMQAQITLSAASFPGIIAGTVDTVLYSNNSISPSVIPAIPPATNAEWDVTNDVADTPFSIYIYYRSNGYPDTAAFPAAQFTDSNMNGYYLTADFQVPFFSEQKAFTPGGYEEYGGYLARYALPVTVYSNPMDSIIFNEQNLVHSSPRTLIKFPATYNSRWSSVYMDSVSYTLNISILGYNNTPAYTKKYITETDTVVGWGYMKVRALSGGSTGYMYVLQVRVQDVEIDSTFVNDSAGSVLLLVGFFGQQGQRATNYTDNFYRPGESRPLASLMYPDSTYTAPWGAATLSQNYNTDLVTAVPVINCGSNINIFPNPVTSRTVTIDITDASGNWTYELTNIKGELAATGALPVNNNEVHTETPLPASLPPGVYYMRLKNNGQEIAVRPLEILKMRN